MNTVLAILCAFVPQQQQPPRPGQAARPGQPARAGMPTHEHEEIEVLRTKTGITLAEKTFEGEVLLTLLSWDDFQDNNVDLDYRIWKFEAAYGITDWITAEAELPFVWVDPDPGSKESGIGDIQLEGKMSFNKNRKSPAGFLPYDLAGGLRFTLPTGDDDEGTGHEHATFTMFGAGSHRFERWVALHAEAYLTWESGERPVHGIHVAGDFTPWMPELSLLGGLNYIRTGGEFLELSLLAGAEYRWPQPLKGMSAGGALLLGLSSDAPDWGLLLNFQIQL